jgi:hypothetical protein
MNAQELKAIVNYLIESYCDNVNADFRHTIKEKGINVTCIECVAPDDVSSVWIHYDYLIDGAGCAKQTTEHFYWDGTEKITMLESYVNDCLDRIYRAELIDERGDDPAVG